MSKDQRCYISLGMASTLQKLALEEPSVHPGFRKNLASASVAVPAFTRPVSLPRALSFFCGTAPGQVPTF